MAKPWNQNNNYSYRNYSIVLLYYFAAEKKNYGKKIGLNSMQQNQGGTPKVIPDL